MRRLPISVPLAILFALLAALPLLAQSVDTYTLKVYNAGGATARSTTSIPVASVICNITAKPAAQATNPGSVVLDDPANAGKFCQWTDAAAGPVRSLPAPGNYELTLTAVNAAGASAESARAPFVRLAPPATPTGVTTAP